MELPQMPESIGGYHEIIHQPEDFLYLGEDPLPQEMLEVIGQFPGPVICAGFEQLPGVIYFYRPMHFPSGIKTPHRMLSRAEGITAAEFLLLGQKIKDLPDSREVIHDF